MRKNFSAVLSVLILATTVLAACAPAVTPTAVPVVSTDTPISSADTVPPTEVAVPMGEVRGVEPKGDGNLTLWIAGNSSDIQGAFDTVVANFENDNPGFNVTVQYVGWGDLSTKLATAFAGNVGPDVFMHGVAASAGFMSKGQIQDLSPYFDQMADKDDFLPAMIEGGTVDGKLAMMPAEITSYMLIYRKDMYEAAGLDPNDPPETWDELIANSVKLTQSDEKGITVAGLQLPYDDASSCEMLYAPILRTYGGDILTADGKQAAFNSDAGKQSLQLYVDLVQNYKVSSLLPLPGDQNASLLGRGAAAQIISGQFDLIDVKTNFPDVYENIGVAIPPVGPSGEPSTMSSFAGFMMGKDAKNPDDAWTLISYLVSPSSLTIIDGASMFLPPRKSLASADYIVTDPLFQSFADALVYGEGNPNVPAWVEVRNTLGEQIIAALNGTVTVDEALANAETAANEALSK